MNTSMTTPPTSGSTVGELPLAERFRPLFVGIRHMLGRGSEFVLLPIEIPDVSVGQGLADWLRNEGLRLSCITPRSPREWQQLVSELQEVQTKPLDARIVAADLGPGFDKALLAVNANRNAIATCSKLPLLWCGKRSFLCRTWEQAPEFWAAAKLVQPLSLRPAAAIIPELEPIDVNGEPLLAHLFDLLESARRRSVIPEVVHIGQHIMRELVQQGRGTEAYDLAVLLVRWLDERVGIYPEIRDQVALHRPTLERAAQALLVHESEIPGATRELLVEGSVTRDRRQPAAPPEIEMRQPVASPPPRAEPVATAASQHPVSEGPALALPRAEPCGSCGGSGKCATCAGSGVWYAGSIDEDECSSCGGSGRCPDC
jgi:hypothetical protein